MRNRVVKGGGGRFLLRNIHALHINTLICTPMSRDIDVRKDVVPGQGSDADTNVNKLPKSCSINAPPAPDYLLLLL